MGILNTYFKSSSYFTKDDTELLLMGCGGGGGVQVYQRKHIATCDFPVMS